MVKCRTCPLRSIRGGVLACIESEFCPYWLSYLPFNLVDFFFKCPFKNKLSSFEQLNNSYSTGWYVVGQLEAVKDFTQLGSLVLLQNNKPLQAGVNLTRTVLTVDDELLVLFQDK